MAFAGILFMEAEQRNELVHEHALYLLQHTIGFNP